MEDRNQKMAKRAIELLTMGDFRSIRHRPISIPVEMIQKICMDEQIKNPGLLIGIYTFIYACAIKEKTNKPWVNNQYIAKGLRIHEDTVAKYRKQLIALGLICNETVRRKGRIIKHVTHLRFYNGITIDDPALVDFLIATLRKNHTLEKPPCGEIALNTYSKRRRNAYRKKRRNACFAHHKSDDAMCTFSTDLFGNTTKPSFSLKCAKKLLRIVKRHKSFLNIHVSLKDVNLSQWAAEFTKLRHLDDPPSKHRIREVLEWYGENLKDNFTPKKQKASTFCKDFGQIESAMERWMKAQGRDVQDDEPECESVRGKTLSKQEWEEACNDFEENE